MRNVASTNSENRTLKFITSLSVSSLNFSKIDHKVTEREIESYLVNVNVSMDIVMNVLGESHVF